MALVLPRFDRNMVLIDENGRPTYAFHLWWQQFAEAIETNINSIEAALVAAGIALDAADAAQAAADAAASAASDAQTAADAAQDAVDAIVVPPTGSRTVSTNTVLTADDANVLVDATAGPITISLFSAGAAVNSNLTVTKIDGSANPVNVVPTGADTLNGGPGPAAITTANAARSFVADGVSAWYG